MSEERRKAVRIKKPLIVQYMDEAGNKLWDISSVWDFSELGMMITTEQPFPEEAVLNFRIRLPSHPYESFAIKGKIISSKSTRSYIYVTRIEFVDIPQECQDALKEYIKWYLDKEGGTK